MRGQSTRRLPGRATITLALAATLFGYAFLSNVAMAIVPHEPVILWYGPRYGIWLTAGIATAGTVLAAWVDHRVFVPLIQRVQHTAFFAEGSIGWLRARFQRVPFLVLAASGLTPLPFFPFKAMAFAEHYPLVRYLGAIAVGRFPRYVLLAWLGVLIEIPTWVLVLLFALMVLPSVRVAWKRRKGK